MFDIHIPFTNLVIFENMMKLCKDIKPNKIIIGGDLLDCYSISRFPQEQHKAEDLHYEITLAVELLIKIRKANPSADIVYILGNHENRLNKFLDTRAKALRNLPSLQIKELLKLDELNIYLQDSHYFVNDNFLVTHGFSCAKQSAKYEFEKWGMSGCSGHVHRSNVHRKNFDNNITSFPKSSFEWHSFGTMADIDQLSYAAPFRNNWDHSQCLIEYDKKDFHIHKLNPSKKTGGFYCPYNGVYYGTKEKKRN